jgi:hypothetical protein
MPDIAGQQFRCFAAPVRSFDFGITRSPRLFFAGILST